MLGAFLIPIGMSSLRGLTHVLTCEQEAKTPFSIIILEDGEPTLTSSTRITRDEPADETVCEGLSLNVSVRAVEGDRLAVEVPITNTSAFQWRGTVRLQLDDNSIPVDIGVIDAGTTETDTITFQLKPGTTELNGALLLGP
jgi:hypothetical protein